MGILVRHTAAPNDSITTVEPADTTLERRAVEAAMWGMPIVTVEAMRRAFVRDAALKKGDIVYWSSMARRSRDITEPGGTLYYAHLTFNTRKGPQVLEVPATAGAVLSGSLCDAWQLPQADVGVEGEDRGRGGKYLLLPPGYAEEVPDGYIPIRLGTHDGFALLRAIAPGRGSRHDARALDLIKGLRLYPLDEAASPGEQGFVDVAGDAEENSGGLTDRYEAFWPGSAWMAPSGGQATVFNGRRASDFTQNIAPYRPAMPARGTAPLYLFGLRDAGQQELDGRGTYRLRVPPSVPTTQFWCVTAYDLETAEVMRDPVRSEVNSLHRTIVRNRDGSVDVLFGAVKPCGRDINWLRTPSGRRWFAAFRMYGPDTASLERNWRLPDIEPLA